MLFVAELCYWLVGHYCAGWCKDSFWGTHQAVQRPGTAFWHQVPEICTISFKLGICCSMQPTHLYFRQDSVNDWCYETLHEKSIIEGAFCPVLGLQNIGVVRPWTVSASNFCVLCLVGFVSWSEGTIWVPWHKLLIPCDQYAATWPVRKCWEHTGSISSRYTLPIWNCWQLWLQGQESTVQNIFLTSLMYLYLTYYNR
jgi:hypothetical protein